MELIITEKNDAASNIAKLLADTSPKADKVYDTSVYRFKRGGEECVVIGLRGHILGVEFPKELAYTKTRGWEAKTAAGETISADIPKGLDTPPWKSKRKPYLAKGLDLGSWKIPVLPYLTFAPLVKEPSEKGIIRSLRNLAKKADSCIIATDFDREGELIGLDALSIVLEENPNIPIKRARYSAFIKKEIQAAFSAENLADLDYDLAHAGESRQFIDLIWGAVLTRYLTVVKYSGIGNVRSAGRVQTPTLALVVAKEKEREAFIPEDYWDISATFAPKGCAADAFKGVHKGNPFKNEEQAKAAFANVKAASEATVVSIKKTSRTIQPPAPFNTTSLQAAASGIGIRPSRTMRIAESLYMSGLISYPRVDNTVYPDGLDHAELLKMLGDNPAYAPYTQALLGKGSFNPTRGKTFSTDHPPIYPTGVASPDTLKADEWKLYNLIARRYLATLSEAAKTENTSIELDVCGERFKASGTVIVKPGWRGVYQYGMKKDEQMPQLSEGEVLDMTEPKFEAKQTEPPRRYSTGTLVQEMEKLGLGTKATRADMIEKLYDRRYIVNDPIEPTQMGVAVIDALGRFAQTITTPDMTASLEEEMNQVAEGKRQRDQVVLHSREALADIVEALIPAKEEVADAITEAVVADSRIGACPKCGGDLCIKQSGKTHSNFVGCNNWPDCDVTYALPQGKYEALEKVCERCGAPIIKVAPFRQRAVERCVNPDCPSNATPTIDLGACPACEAAGRSGKLIGQTNPKTMKRFVRCSNHPECDYSGPLPARGDIKALHESCPDCGAPMIQVDNGSKRGPWNTCINMDCPSKAKDNTKPKRTTRKKK